MATKPVFDDIPEWPAPRSDAPPSKGHNRPPPEEVIPLEFREQLLADHPDFLTVLDRYLGVGGEGGAVDRASATDDESLGACGKVVKFLRNAEKHVADTHKAVKQPYLDAGRLVDAEKNALVGRILAGRDKVEGVMNAYAAKKRAEEAEEARRRDAERRRLEELARENNIEAALPPPPPPPPAATQPVRTDGATISTVIEYVCEVEDYGKAFKKVKDDAKVREAIDAAIKRIVKATKGQPIPGVRIWESTKTISR